MNQLAQLGRLLVDILGQHDHQSLLDVSRHLEILDEFGDDEHRHLKSTVRELYSRYEQVKRERIRLQTQERDRLARIDLLQFQLEEITQANLRVGEEDELEKQQQRLANIERITTTAESVYARLQEQLPDQPPLYDLSPDYQRFNVSNSV